MTATEPRLDHDARCPIWTGAPVELCTCRDDDGHAPHVEWARGPLVCLDTETTGVQVDEDRIVTACLVRINPGEAPIIRTWLADPGVAIPAEATAVHQITEEYAAEHGRPTAEVVAEIEDVLLSMWSDAVLIAANASFDLSILDAELRRHHSRRLRIAGPVIDPMVCDRHVWKYRKGSRKLVDLCATYRVRLEGDAHDATNDALAAARVAWRIAQEYPDEVGNVDPRELHAAQIRWYATQQKSFARYLRDKVAPKETDPDEQRAVRERADAVEAQAGGWPLRVIGGRL